MYTKAPIRNKGYVTWGQVNSYLSNYKQLYVGHIARERVAVIVEFGYPPSWTTETIFLPQEAYMDSNQCWYKGLKLSLSFSSPLKELPNTTFYHMAVDTGLNTSTTHSLQPFGPLFSLTFFFYFDALVVSFR